MRSFIVHKFQKDAFLIEEIIDLQVLFYGYLFKSATKLFQRPALQLVPGKIRFHNLPPLLLTL